MSNALEITTATFGETTGTGVSLVDFWAEWCGPCKMITPMINELAEEFDGKATIGKVNADENQDLLAQHNVASLPTLLVLKNGEEVNRFIGITPKEELAEAITTAIG